MIKPFRTPADVFKTLAHPARLAILSILRDGEQCVCHIEAMLKLRQAYISQHLKVLKDAEIVTDRRDGWNMYYRVSRPEVFEIMDAMFALTGQPGAIPHAHSPAGRLAPAGSRPERGTSTAGRSKEDCPCPKCHPEKGLISADRVLLKTE
jgi:ArsR family transcriptional regulator